MWIRWVSWWACLGSDAWVGRVSGILGSLWWWCVPYRRRVIRQNLDRAFPGTSTEEKNRLGRAACVHLVRSLYELLRLPRYRSEDLTARVEVRGHEHYRAAKAQGRGVLCLSAHLGSFELTVQGAAPEVAPAWLVVKSFSPSFDRYVNEQRAAAGLGVIRAKGAIRPVLKALARNEIVAFVMDQNATRKIGVFVDFFGEPACTLSALAVLAERTGAPVIAAACYREPDGRHVLELFPEIPLERRDTRASTVRHMTRRYTEWIEERIRRRPEQWFWTHRRWKTRPKVESERSS